MAQITHENMSLRSNEQQEVPETPVHTVMPPEDEAVFAAQMEQTAQDFAKQLPLDKPEIKNDPDPILERESKRRDIFNKLVLLKEDHYKEVKLGGLTFKMRLLNSDDNEFITDAVKDMTGDRLSNLSKLVLAAAIVEVEGVKFEEFYTGAGDVRHPILRKYHEINQYQLPVRNALQKAYSDFQAEVEGEYTQGFLKK